MAAFKSLFPLILMAFFLVAIVVSLIVMGIRGILKKRGFEAVTEKNGWSLNLGSEVKKLESILTPTLFTVQKSSGGTHTLKDVIHGSFKGINFYFANYTYREQRTQGHGIHDEYSLFVVPRKTKGANFWFVVTPKMLQSMMGSLTRGELKKMEEPRWDWIMTSNPDALRSVVSGENTPDLLRKILNSQDSLFFFDSIIIWSIKNFQSPGKMNDLLENLKTLIQIL